MSGLSAYMQRNILNYFKGIDMPPAPTTLWLALFNGDPTDNATGGVEVTAGIRPSGRLQVTFGAIAADSTMTNSSIVDFGNSASTVNITHFALFDSASGGLFYGSGSIGAGGAQTIGAGTGVTFAVGSLIINAD